MANQFNKMQMPVANQAVADQKTAANALQMQQQMGRVSASQALSGGMQAAQQMGAELAQKQGQVMAQKAQSDAQKLAQDSQNQMRHAQLAQHSKNLEIKKQLEQNRMAKEKQLNAMGRDIQHKIIDAQHRFQQTARGIQLGDERQYEDFLTMKQVSDQEWQSHQQHVEQQLKSKLQMLDFAYDYFKRKHEESFKEGQRQADKASQDRIEAALAALERERKKAARGLGRTNKMMGVAKVALGAYRVYSGDVTGGGSMIASGAKQYQQGEAQDQV